MFVPLHKTPELRNPPLVTLGLMSALVLIFLFLQGADHEYEQQAYEYYFSSDLPGIEIPAYLAYLKSSARTRELEALSQALQKNYASGIKITSEVMHTDGRFRRQLYQEKIFPAGHPNRDSWQQQRQRFDYLLSRSSAFQYGLIPAELSAISLVSYMFLHTDLLHLVFNLIFLFIFGFIIEMAAGKVAVLFGFLLSGVLSGLLAVMLEPDSAAWTIGASGAIAGLAGAYTVLFGMQRIRFFYFAFFYFNFITAPALILLPIWLGYEIIDYLFGLNEVNNFAHIGGLSSGALLGWLIKRHTPLVDHDYIQSANPGVNVSEQLDIARKLIAVMEFERAEKFLRALETQVPQDLDVKRQRFNLALLQKNEVVIQQTADQLFSLGVRHNDYVSVLAQSFTQYHQACGQKNGLEAELAFELLKLFLCEDMFKPAELVLDELLDHHIQHPQVPAALMLFIKTSRRLKQKELSGKFSRILSHHFPTSPEAKMLASLDAAN